MTEYELLRIVDHSDLVILVWNGYPASSRGGTADVASYARLVRRPFIHIHTRLHMTKQYGKLLADSGATTVFLNESWRRQSEQCIKWCF